MNKKRIISTLFVSAVALIIMPYFMLYASNENSIVVEIPDFRAGIDNYGSVVTHQVVRNPDGTVLQMRAGETSFSVEISDGAGNVFLTKTIPFELPKFGAFFSGSVYNFAIFGQENYAENNNAEVYRLVRYTKNWDRIDSLSIYGGTQIGTNTDDIVSTVNPFDFASARIAEYGNTLAIHTGRLLYKSGDGLNHQAAQYILVNTENMSIIPFDAPWCSHSFDQYVLFDNDTPVFLDHGDAYPRAIVVNRVIYEGTEPYYYRYLSDGSESQVWQSSWGSYYDWNGDVPANQVQQRQNHVFTHIAANVLNIPGSIGDNWTGVSLGGFAMSDENYLALYNRTESTNYNGDIQRDIYIGVLPRNFTNQTAATHTLISRYTGTDRIASTPVMTKINNNSFALYWAEYDRNSRQLLGYVLQYIDGRGQSVGARREFNNLNIMIAEILSVERINTGTEATVIAQTPVGVVITEQYSQSEIIVTIDEQQVIFADQPPVIIDGRTLVPVRGVFEQLGFHVSWNDETRQATLSSDRYTVVLTIGSTHFTTNGVNYTLDVPAQIINGRTMLPLRAVLESVGYFLDWNENTRTVIISS